MSSNQYELSDPPTDRISSVRFAPGSSTKLLVSSWDKHLYLYDIAGSEDGVLVKKFEHHAVILQVCWGKDDTEAFIVGVDTDVRRIDLETSEQTVLSTHDQPSSRVVYSREHNLLISGSWDKTLHLHFPARADTPEHASKTPLFLTLDERVYSLSLSPTKLVVALAGGTVLIYELETLAQLLAEDKGAPNNKPTVRKLAPWQKRESSLKHQTRCVAVVTNGTGFATSSTEGRVAVDWFDPSPESQAKKYAFKCHRQTVDNLDLIYPVNAVEFHPEHITFATGGGDGVVSVWDAQAKRRIRQYQRFPCSVEALSFSGDGRYLAIAISPAFVFGEWEQGPIKVFVRELGPNEARGKDRS